MICPHCNYEHLQATMTSDPVGDFGDFYKSSLIMEQQWDYANYVARVYGCPVCKKTFIGD